MRIETRLGKYSQVQARKNLKKGIPTLLISYIILLITGLYYLPIYKIVGGLAPIMYFCTGAIFMYGITQFIAPYQHWKMGINGERKVVNNISNKLGNEHALFNNVILKDGIHGGDIDHIIVGPRGIFAIETKHIHGDVTVKGDDWKGVRGSPSRQAKKHAGRIYTLLNNSNVLNGDIPLVEAIVVLSSKKTKLIITQNPDRCKIIQIKDLADNSLYEYIMQHTEIVYSTQEIEIVIQFLKSNFYSN